jgi:hypothetical protein
MNTDDASSQTHNAQHGWWSQNPPCDFDAYVTQRHHGDAGEAGQTYAQLYHAFPPLDEGHGRVGNTLGHPPQTDADVRKAQGEIEDKLTGNKSDDGAVRGYNLPDYRR